MSEEVQSVEQDEAHELDHLRSHIKFYWGIFGLLILGTILTVFVPKVVHFHMHTYNVILGLAIATVKASLVSLFFMHLAVEKRLIYVMLALAVFGALALSVLTGLAYWNHHHSLIW